MGAGAQEGAMHQISGTRSGNATKDQRHSVDGRETLSSGEKVTAKKTWQSGQRADHSRKADEGDSVSRDVDNSITGSSNAAYSTSDTHTQTADRKWNYNSDVSVEDMMYAANGGMGGYDPRGFEQIQATGAALQQMSAGVRAAAAEERAERAEKVAAEFGRLEKMSYGKGGLHGPQDYSGLVSGFINDKVAAVEAERARIAGASGAVIADAGDAAQGHNPMDINNIHIDWKDKSVRSENSYFADGAALGAGLLTLSGGVLEAAAYGRSLFGGAPTAGAPTAGAPAGASSFMDHAKTVAKVGAVVGAGVHLWDQHKDPSGTDDRMLALYNHWGVDAPDSMGGYVAGRGALLAADTLNSLSFGLGQGILGLDSAPPK